MKFHGPERKPFEASARYIRSEQQERSPQADVDRLKQQYWPALSSEFPNGRSYYQIGDMAVLYPERRTELGLTESCPESLRPLFQEQARDEYYGERQKVIAHLFQLASFCIIFSHDKQSIQIPPHAKEHLIAEMQDAQAANDWTHVPELLFIYKILFPQENMGVSFAQLKEDMIHDSKFPPEGVSSRFFAYLFAVYPDFRQRYSIHEHWSAWVKQAEENKSIEEDHYSDPLVHLAMLAADEIRIDDDGVSLLTHSAQQQQPDLPARSIV